MCQDERIKEACGVFGIYNPHGEDAASSIYYGLSSLQHRGQESCGIAVFDTSGPKGNMNVQRGMGLVSEVFKEDVLSNMKGNLGIGHVRYSTTGAATLSNAQPLVLNYIKGTLALAHNGNLVNTEELRNELAQNGAIFHTTTDSEVIAYYIARERVRTKSVEEAIMKTAEKIKGAYGLVIASPRKLIGVRDPLGLKPLCLGKRDDSYIIASESCALTAIGAQFLRDIKPGEIVTITREGITSNLTLCQSRQAHCIFEYIYFARLDSKLDGISVYESRLRAGAALAKAYPADADLVVGVPDSGITAAQATLKDIGIDLDINCTADNNSVADDPTAWDVYAMANVQAPTGDPEYWFTVFATSDATRNQGKYSSEKLDELEKELSAEFDIEKRAELAVQMQQTVLDDHAFVFCSFLKMNMISKANVTGYESHACDYYQVTADLDIN